MALAYKRKLSGSTDGRGIKVVATATPGTLIHTAVAGTTPGTFDEVWIYAYNSDGTDRILTIEFGGTTNPDDTVKATISSQQGAFMVIPGWILQNGTIVRAFASTANVVIVYGYVNTITD